MAEPGQQKQFTVNENQERPSGICGEDGSHSKHETTYSFPLEFFLILDNLFLLFFSLSSRSCVQFKHLPKAPDENLIRVQTGGALCMACTCGKSRRGEKEESPYGARLRCGQVRPKERWQFYVLRVKKKKRNAT